MSSDSELLAGAAQKVITPEVGCLLHGWEVRAAGHNRSTYIHDDLYLKALAMSRDGSGWLLITADIIGMDSECVQEIRAGIAARTDLAEDAVMCSATHCHSAPLFCPVDMPHGQDLSRLSNFYGRENIDEIDEPAQRRRGVADADWDAVDPKWRENFVQTAISMAIQAWDSRQPAEVAYEATDVEGVASSRRVQLSDGSWTDPRVDSDPQASEVYRSTFDPALRIFAVRSVSEDSAPIAACVNYGSHTWVYSTSAISAELPGVVYRKLADAWSSSEQAPVILYTSGPEGDVTNIWNIAIDEVWKTEKDEPEQDSLARREEAFDAELEKLGSILAERAYEAIGNIRDWRRNGSVEATRRQVALTLMEDYLPPETVKLAEWQRACEKEGVCQTEIQALRCGDFILLGLPGEPFVSIGNEIRKLTECPLMISALSNDAGQFSYLAMREDYERGEGYELSISPLAEGSGEELVSAVKEMLAGI